MPDQRPNRVNVLLDDEHAAKLYGIADRTYVNAGTLARSLLSRALDQADPDPASITDILDAIPGAFKRTQRGVADVQAGRVVSIDEL